MTYFDTVYEFSENELMDKYYAAIDFILRYHEIEYKLEKSNKEFALFVIKKYLGCKYIKSSLIKRIKNIYNEIKNKEFKNNK